MTRAYQDVIWSMCHNAYDVEYACAVIDRAVAEGVGAVELEYTAVDRVIGFRDFPVLAGQVDARRLAGEQNGMRKICDRARRHGVRLGIWHHEISEPVDGPPLLELLPGLRGQDGLLDLEAPLLYQLIRSRVREFFDLFPEFGELVLTLTETAYPVLHRPFCPIPAAERVRRVLEAITDVTDSLGKRLVIRPFSALRQDEEAVHQAVRLLKGRNIIMMYKTEPADWHPFLPDEPMIGSLPEFPCRAETDGGGEYYGQSAFPCVYVRHLECRLRAAAAKGATVAVLRVDRGAHRPALGHPTNELNVLAITRWLQQPDRPLSEQVIRWLRETHGCGDSTLCDCLEQTFTVIQKTLYIDRQSISHLLFPTLTHAKHIQVFSLFEENVPLDHLRENWAVLSARSTLTHEQILAEKQEACELAQMLAAKVRHLLAGAPDAAQQAVNTQMEHLVGLTGAVHQWCRVIVAHLEEAWCDPRPITSGFEAESAVLLQLADAVEAAYGSDFFSYTQTTTGAQRRQKVPGQPMGMARAMRTLVDGLRQERAVEWPRRQALAADPQVLDYVLCGLASEGHRLRKRLHSGATLAMAGGFARATGLGVEEGFGYRLYSGKDAAGELVIDLHDEGVPAKGLISIAGQTHALAVPGQAGVACQVSLPVSIQGAAEVRIWSTGTQRLCLAGLALRAPRINAKQENV